MEILGFYTFLLLATMAFWILIFLATFLPYWITLQVLDLVNPDLAEKLAIIKVEKE